MIRPLVLLAAGALLVGCQASQPGLDPFMTPRTVPPPPTGSIVPGSTQPYYQSQPYYQGDPLPQTQPPVSVPGSVPPAGQYGFPQSAALRPAPPLAATPPRNRLAPMADPVRAVGGVVRLDGPPPVAAAPAIAAPRVTTATSAPPTLPTRPPADLASRPPPPLAAPRSFVPPTAAPRAIARPFARAAVVRPAPGFVSWGEPPQVVAAAPRGVPSGVRPASWPAAIQPCPNGVCCDPRGSFQPGGYACQPGRAIQPAGNAIQPAYYHAPLEITDLPARTRTVVATQPAIRPANNGTADVPRAFAPPVRAPRELARQAAAPRAASLPTPGPHDGSASRAASVSYTTRASAPQRLSRSTRYGYHAEYEWLRGRLEYLASTRQWKLRYIPIDGETDRYGGSVVIADPARLEGFQAGEFVSLRGTIAEPPAGERSFAPSYQIAQIERMGSP